jgi:hypothetical protein
MPDILYIGDPVAGNVAKEYAKKNELSIDFMLEKGSADIINLRNALDYICSSTAKVAIVNMEQCDKEDTEIFAESIKDIARYSTSQVVLHTTEYEQEHALVQQLLRAGAVGGIFSKGMGAPARELEALMSKMSELEIGSTPSSGFNGIPEEEGSDVEDVREPAEFIPDETPVITEAEEAYNEQDEETVAPEEEPYVTAAETESENVMPAQGTIVTKEVREEMIRSKEAAEKRIDDELPEGLKRAVLNPDVAAAPIHIAVVGSMPRMGVTTAALQLVRYLDISENKACYIEKNNTGFAASLPEYFEDTQTNEKTSLVRCKGIDLYADSAKMNLIKIKGYTHYVYDFGAFEEISDSSAYLEKDILVAVIGIKPQEQESMFELLPLLASHENIYYLINYAHPDEREEIKRLMEDRSPRTLFLSYAPDPFTFTAEHKRPFEIIVSAKVDNTLTIKKKRFKR